MTWLVVGLGNPGTQYTLTRHNIGFLAVDYLCEGSKAKSWNSEHKALTCKIKLGEQALLLAKPQTFMNLSGESVQSLMQFYKIPLDHLIVLHDDIDQAFGAMRLHKNRGHGGHNGIRSISQLLGTADYLRVKLGVGRPVHPEMQVVDYVLQKFSADEQQALPDYLNKAGDAVESLIVDGLQKAATLYNA